MADLAFVHKLILVRPESDENPCLSSPAETRLARDFLGVGKPSSSRNSIHTLR
jgi:hypothetical protein